MRAARLLVRKQQESNQDKQHGPRTTNKIRGTPFRDEVSLEESSPFSSTPTKKVRSELSRVEPKDLSTRCKVSTRDAREILPSSVNVFK